VAVRKPRGLGERIKPRREVRTAMIVAAEPEEQLSHSSEQPIKASVDSALRSAFSESQSHRNNSLC
jgi:hypothetical protein